MLKDAELDKVNGGMCGEDTKKVSCPVCFEVFEVSSNKKTATCPSCGKTFTINT